MSRRRKAGPTGALLDLWRPPQDSGNPLGCLATTYTFAPGLFDEQCLARFLEIESEPNREDLAFLLERESRLGGVYAGVLVDHTQSGVEHSLRWDVLPVRIPRGKQHAKLSLLAWTGHVRVLVASANLTEQGYRQNHEVAASVDLNPRGGNADVLRSALDFLESLLLFVPGPAEDLPTLARARGFLHRVRTQTRSWVGDRRRGAVHQHLVATLPPRADQPARSSLEEAVLLCRRRGQSPDVAWVASPFFDGEAAAASVTAALCKRLARGGDRNVRFCVPAIPDEATTRARLAAPRSLLDTPERYNARVRVRLLPRQDADKNPRPWHAKLLALKADVQDGYDSLMIGSSNFTTAGLGVGLAVNAEVNLLTIVDREKYARESGALDDVWPDMEWLQDPQGAEWTGIRPEMDEEERVSNPPVPPGFLSAIYRAGPSPEVLLRLDPEKLPPIWTLTAVGRTSIELLSSTTWQEAGRRLEIPLPWPEVQPPEKLLVKWGDLEAFFPINVEDGSALPPPSHLDHMSADDMLGILAAADPSAAFRAWAARQEKPGTFDETLDSATPIDLDPLRWFDLEATFLHRVRRRARALAQVRSNLQRPVWTRQALEWRLRGPIGVQAVAERLVREMTGANGKADEALLGLADFLIVLREVDYRPDDGALTEAEFREVYSPFLRGLARSMQQQVGDQRCELSIQPAAFWDRVVKRCLE